MICIFLLPVNLQKYKILGHSEIKIASYMLISNYWLLKCQKLRSIFLFNIKFAIVYAWIEIEYTKSRNIFDLMIIDSILHLQNMSLTHRKFITWYLILTNTILWSINQFNHQFLYKEKKSIIFNIF